MRAAGQSVQDPNPKRGVGVLMMCLLRFVRDVVRMGVQVQMPVAIVFVFVRMDMEGFAHRPGAYADEHNAHEPFAPGGKQVHRQQLSQPEREQTD